MAVTFSLESVLELEHWRGSRLLPLLQHALQQRLRPRWCRRGVGPGGTAAATAGRRGPVPLPLEKVASLAEALHLHAGNIQFASSVFDWLIKLEMRIMEIFEIFNKCRGEEYFPGCLSLLAVGPFPSLNIRAQAVGSAVSRPESEVGWNCIHRYWVVMASVPSTQHNFLKICRTKPEA